MKDWLHTSPVSCLFTIWYRSLNCSAISLNWSRSLRHWSSSLLRIKRASHLLSNFLRHIWYCKNNAPLANSYVGNNNNNCNTRYIYWHKNASSRYKKCIWTHGKVMNMLWSATQQRYKKEYTQRIFLMSDSSTYTFWSSPVLQWLETLALI